MSIRPAQFMFTPGYVQVKPEPEFVGPQGNSHSFRDLLAASVADKVAGGIGSQAAKAAEILHLEMLRSALSLDGTLPSPSLDKSGVAALLSVTEAGVQEIDTLSKGSSLPAASRAAGATALRTGSAPAIDAVISRASRRYGVEESLIRAVIKAESDFMPAAVSSAGAQGLMQLMPATAAGLGVTDPFNPEQNVMAGTRFLKELLTRYGGDLDKALAAYNWGPGNLDRGKGRLPRETRDYLAKVKNLYATYRG